MIPFVAPGGTPEGRNAAEHDQAVPTDRIAIRPVTISDAPLVEPWLGEAEAAVRGQRSMALSSLDQFLGKLDPWQQAFLLTLSDGVPVGIAVVSDRAQPAPRIDFLAVAAGYRNVGLGSEAVLAIEARFGTPMFAGVPLTNGLAIYFWLRAGYRPWYPRGSAGFPSDRLWMVREPELT